jgi:hypothetical protein|tara:strand:- start:628 stop:765 length:138 start_codon:yes stop_codon:yes gene_type:complete
MNVLGWVMFLIIIGVDIAIYAMVSMYFDGTWKKLTEDMYDNKRNL